MTDCQSQKLNRNSRSILPVLRSRLSMMICVALIGPSVALAEYTGPSVLRAAMENCGPTLEQGGTLAFDTLLPATPDQVATFSRNFRLFPNPDAVWSQPEGVWHLSQRGSRLCEIIAVAPSTDEMAAEWTVTFDGADTAFRAGLVSVEPQRDESAQTRGFATRPVKDGFIQLSLASFETETGHTITSVASAYVEQSPASCELWPEECNK